MGKNYSTNQHKGKRNKNDYYPTPYLLTEKFLVNYPLDIDQELFDPATGEAKAIERVAHELGYNIGGTDLIYGDDFLTSTVKRDWIITNPPFSLFNQFYYKAFHYSKNGFSFFSKVDFLSGKERFDFLYSKELRPNYVYIFSRKANLLGEFREDGKYSTGIDSMCWMVKEHGNNNDTILRWIDNDEDVFRKKKKKYIDPKKYEKLIVR